MPYVICSECRVTTYSAALWSGSDECPSCGQALPVPRASAIAPADGAAPSLAAQTAADAGSTPLV